MKKVLNTIAAIMCVLALNGCATAKKSTQKNEQTVTENSETQFVQSTASSETVQENAYKIGDAIKTDKWEITVNSVDVTDELKEEFIKFEPDEGNKYLVITLTAKNIGKEKDTFLATYSSKIKLKVNYKDYEFSGTNLIGYDNNLIGKSANPLSSISGIVAFEIADEIADYKDEMSLTIKDLSSLKSKTYTIRFEQSNQSESAASSTTPNERTAQ